MSKSKGNFLRLQSLLDKGYSALDYRFFLLGGHYRKQIYFSWDAMDGAKNSRASLVQKVAKLAESAGGKSALNPSKVYAKGEAASKEGLSAKAAEYLDAFQAALENDLATPVALSQIQMAVKDSALDAKEALELVARMDSVLGLSLIKSAAEALESAQKSAENLHEGDPEAAEIDALVQERVQAKKDKNFARADQIRDELTARGIVVTDTPNGPVWQRK